MKRRDFISSSLLAAGMVTLNTRKLFSMPGETYFGVHSFIENNPNAVFILKTNIDAKTDTAAIKNIAQQFGNSVLANVSQEDGGMPVSSKIALKPNLTDRTDSNLSSVGVQSDVNFIEGIVDSLVDLGATTSNMYIREANSERLFKNSLFDEMAVRRGLNLKETSKEVTYLSPEDYHWVDVEDGEFFKRIPYLWPYAAPETFMINIAKLKSHWMGITSCSKNLQGSIAKPYVRHCTPIGQGFGNVNPADYFSDSYLKIMSSYIEKRDSGFPRYQKQYASNDEASKDWAGPVRMETWMRRMFDNNKTLKVQLHISEGIYSREGAIVAEQPADFRELMTNIILFGKNPFAIDVIATYLAGHEPGNFAQLQRAWEKGLTGLNPFDIPIYEWNLTGDATPANLADFERFELRTEYLQQENEEKWHMVNEAFDYTDYPYSVPASSDPIFNKPGMELELTGFPNPFSSTTSVRYHLPRSGHVLIEVTDMSGRVVHRLVREYQSAGQHLVRWSPDGLPSGIYFCRMQFMGFTDVIKLNLING